MGASTVTIRLHLADLLHPPGAIVGRTLAGLRSRGDRVRIEAPPGCMAATRRWLRQHRLPADYLGERVH